MKVEEFIDQLNQRYNKDDVILVHLWQPCDVLLRAEDRDITLNESEAEDILGCIEHKIDCEVGVNWDVIDCFTDSYVEDNVTVYLKG